MLLSNGTADKVGAGDVDKTIERLYARAWRCLYVFPEANNSADDDPNLAVKCADGRMYIDIQRQMTLFCAPAKAAIMALPSSGISRAWRKASAILTPLQFTTPGGPSGQSRARTRRTHMWIRGWQGLKTATAAPAAPTRSRRKTGFTRSQPKANTTNYVAAIVKQFAPCTITRHDHPAVGEALCIAAANLRKRFGPDAAPLDAAAALASGLGTAHKCWRLLPTKAQSGSKQAPAPG